MDASSNTHRDRFERYCRAKFSGSTRDADGDSAEASATPSTSKAIWKEKGTRIVHVLKGDPVALNIIIQSLSNGKLEDICRSTGV